MKKIILTLSVLLLISSFTFAQEKECEKECEQKKWGMLFQFSNFDLHAFNGSTLGLEYLLNDNYSLRGGLSLSFKIEDIESEHPESGNAIIPKGESESITQFYGLDFQIIRKFLSFPKLKSYVGIGPHFSYRHYDRSSISDLMQYGDTINVIRNDFDQILNFGASISVGVEWEITKFLSIVSEYSSSIVFRTEEKNKESYSTRNGSGSFNNSIRNSNGWIISPNSVKLGIIFFL